jgi:hypothetical protein
VRYIVAVRRQSVKNRVLHICFLHIQQISLTAELEFRRKSSVWWLHILTTLGIQL